MTIEKDNGLRGRPARVIKQIDGDGSDAQLTLLISTDAMDSEGDVVEQEWEVPGQLPVLFAHDNKSPPVGHGVNLRVVDVRTLPQEVRSDLSEDAEKATLLDINVDEEDPFAMAVLRKYRRGDMEDSSVGFDPIEMDRFGDDEPGRFHFMRQALKELSLLPIGANGDTTVLRKSFDPDVIPEQLMDDDADEPEGKDDAPDHTKEGRRNSKMDEAVQEHIKECAEYLKGDREMGDVKECPLHKMDDDKSGDDQTEKSAEPTMTIELHAEEVAELVVEKWEAAQADKGQDGADEPEGDGLRIEDGKIIDLTKERSEEPGSSSGDAGDGDTSETTIDELFAQ